MLASVPAAAADAAFDRWTKLASAHPVSPAKAEPGDATMSWTGVDGRRVGIVVKAPRSRPDAPTVTMDAVPPGQDAGPALARALASVKARGGARLVIPKGVYSVAAPAPGAQGHVTLQGLNDITIDGGGSTLVFAANRPGLYVTQSKRVRIQDLVLDFAIRTSSVAEATAGPDGTTLTIVDPPTGIGPDTDIGYVAEYDPASRRWVPGGKRVILPPGHPDTATYAGGQTFRSPGFRILPVGSRYTVFHQFYGGTAIQIQDSPASGDRQVEDISIERITIRSAPGMGVVAYGLKRGLLVTKMTMTPKPGQPASANFDAIHIQLSGGDTIISDNRIERQGDDGINFNSPVHPVVSLDGDQSLVLGTYSRFVSEGDTLAFFDTEDRFIGEAKVVGKPVSRGGPNMQNYEIALDRPVPGLTPQSVARDVDLIGGRYAVVRNGIGPCHCNAILAQLPHGLIADNTIEGANFASVNLLTSVGPFKEGVGAIDVIVRNNTIRSGGIKQSARLPWAAINAYGLSRSNAGTAGPVNRDIAILGNSITGSRQGCITVMATDGAEIRDNRCQDTNATSRGASITVQNATRVSLKGNTRAGGTTGAMNVDAASGTAQADY